MRDPFGFLFIESSLDIKSLSSLLEFLNLLFSLPNFFFIRLIYFGFEGRVCPVTTLYNPTTLFSNVLNALLAFFLIVFGTWFTNQLYQSLSLLVTCGLFLHISCCSNISISPELDRLPSSCLSNSDCHGLSGLNLTIVEVALEVELVEDYSE